MSVSFVSHVLRPEQANRSDDRRNLNERGIRERRRERIGKGEAVLADFRNERAFRRRGFSSGSRRFHRVDSGIFGIIEGAADPRRETTSSQKNGWAANRVPPMEPMGERFLFLPSARSSGPLRGGQARFNNRAILNCVFTCVVAR